MKILGLSFGRKGKNSDILLKEALFAAKNAGADVKFINTNGLNIGRCTQCGACTRAKLAGKELRCWLNDDFTAIQRHIIEADGIILAAPVYSCGPTGQLKNVIDRNGAPMDKCSLVREKARREKENLAPLDEQLFKERFVAYISIGGATTQNWVSFGLPTMSLFGFSGLMKITGLLDAYGTGAYGCYLMPDLREKAAEIGKTMAWNLANPGENFKYVGPEGTCPVCHNNFLSFNGTTTVECPICGIYGKLTVDGSVARVYFPQAEQDRSRYKMAGLAEHQDEIGRNVIEFMRRQKDNKDFIESEAARFDAFQDTY